jgi:geranylgeranyl pyrophosphate synthase
MLETLELEAVRKLLCEHLQSYLEDLPPALCEDIVGVLSEEGKLFHQPASALDGRWALLPFYLAYDLCADVWLHPPCAVALAMECVVSATDLLDATMLDYGTPLLARMGMARVLKTATALAHLVQRILSSLSSTEHPDSLLEMVQRAMQVASIGQQREMLATRRSVCEVSQEECIEIASARTGTLLALACEMGAVCARVEPNMRQDCAELGRLLGIAQHLENDAREVSQLLQPSRPATPRARPLKKTLPVVVAGHILQATRSLDGHTIETVLSRLSLLQAQAEGREDYVRALHEGLQAAWDTARAYRGRAQDYLETLEREGAVSPGLREILLEQVPVEQLPFITVRMVPKSQVNP